MTQCLYGSAYMSAPQGTAITAPFAGRAHARTFP